MEVSDGPVLEIASSSSRRDSATYRGRAKIYIVEDRPAAIETAVVEGRLEKLLECMQLETVGTRPRLPVGETFVHGARLTLATMNDLMDVVARDRQSLGGLIRIGTPPILHCVNWITSSRWRSAAISA
ncbi:hypothetical protein [Ensifer sp. SL37]|uniref:hypothetical protein n=1 Tax=Ensifer sp. SL37 TaxID=2995137 RepID=UPI0022746313|nr:hypothetical protein [Ensifer sp. SL37]MCY1745131.1 hypothetical protein [Ensifer sp. SL37]